MLNFDYRPSPIRILVDHKGRQVHLLDDEDRYTLRTIAYILMGFLVVVAGLIAIAVALG